MVTIIISLLYQITEKINKWSSRQINLSLYYFMVLCEYGLVQPIITKFDLIQGQGYYIIFMFYISKLISTSYGVRFYEPIPKE